MTLDPTQGGRPDLEGADSVIETASKELGNLCKARWAGGEEWNRVWHWEIPANPERDTDLRIGAAISLAQEAVAYARSLERALVAYSSHSHQSAVPAMCERAKHSEYPCTCGLDSILKPILDSIPELNCHGMPPEEKP